MNDLIALAKAWKTAAVAAGSIVSGSDLNRRYAEIAAKQVAEHIRAMPTPTPADVPADDTDDIVAWVQSLPAEVTPQLREAYEFYKRNTLPAQEGGRDSRQKIVAEWCAAAFGEDQASSIEQRGIRLLEEAIETYQACGASAGMAHKMVDYIFERPAGTIEQELGGVGVTTLALANAAGISADHAEAKEVARVLAKPLAHFTARNQFKNDAGFAATPADAAGVKQRAQAGRRAWERWLEEIGAVPATLYDPVRDAFLSGYAAATPADVQEGEVERVSAAIKAQCQEEHRLNGTRYVTLSMWDFDYIARAAIAALHAMPATKGRKE